jgi:hypothetical protein
VKTDRPKDFLVDRGKELIKVVRGDATDFDEFDHDLLGHL